MMVARYRRCALLALLTIALTACGGEEFGTRASNISGCAVGDWERLGPRLSNRSALSLSFLDDGTFVRTDSDENASDGTSRVRIEVGPWFQHGDAIVRVILKVVDGYGATVEEATEEAQQALLTTPERAVPYTRGAGSTHCDSKHFKDNVLVKLSSAPDVFRIEQYLGFNQTWPTRTPTGLSTEQLTLHGNGIAGIQRTRQYFDGSGEDTATTTHAAWSYRSSMPDGRRVLALVSCNGQIGCDNPEYIPTDIEYVDWGTALSTGTTYGVDETTGKADYFAR